MSYSSIHLRRIYALGTLFALANACTPSPRSTLKAPEPASTTTKAPAGQDQTKAQAKADPAAEFAKRFTKRQVRVKMRDGVELFTTIYAPKDQSKKRPILLLRTPYSSYPYEADAFPGRMGMNPLLANGDYIFAFQDVRGTFMSDGTFVNMRPHLPEDPSKAETHINESTDTYDTIDWLVKNVPQNNGRVGMWGISYPGYYAAAGMIDAHPALVAVSPQAPIADWYFDDFHHHGAFFLPHAFNFLAIFGKMPKGRHKEWPDAFDHKTPDGYAFFSRLGSLKNANEKYLKGEIDFWNKIVEHPDRDAFWQSRDILPHLKNTAPAVLTVGGWYDAEDLYGPLKIFERLEKNSPKASNHLIMGPWVHGGWARGDGQTLGDGDFGSNTSQYYQAKIEKPFFDQALIQGKTPELPTAHMFETGSNTWRNFDQWPPQGTRTKYFLGQDGTLSPSAPTASRAFDEYTSDPAHPVPYTEETTVRMTRSYMIADQRFAARRPDVLTYQSPPLSQSLTVAGEIAVDLWVSTNRQDADWVVKLIDVYPASSTAVQSDKSTLMGEYQMMVRSEVFRGRYREGYDRPRPFSPGKATQVKFPLQDVLHTFKPGHRVMIQIQSSWFPLVDRNPQSWVDNIFKAQDQDFVSAQHRVYRQTRNPSSIEFTTIPTLAKKADGEQSQPSAAKQGQAQ